MIVVSGNSSAVIIARGLQLTAGGSSTTTTYTSAEFAVLDPTTFGRTPARVTDVAGFLYVEYVSNGTVFVETLKVSDAGDVVAEIVPRTDILSTLETVIGTDGELASATDTPAIVQLNGTSAPGTVFRPGQSFESVSVATAAATLPSKYDIVRVSLLTAATITLSIDNGISVGQQLSVIVEASTIDVTTVVIGGVSVDISDVVDTEEEMIETKLEWTGSSWKLQHIFNKSNSVTNKDSVAIGSNNTVSGEGSIVVGLENTCSGKHSFVTGDGNILIDRYGLAVGLDNLVASEYGFAVGSGNKVGNQSAAIGLGCYTGGKTETVMVTGTDPYTFTLDSTADASLFYFPGNYFVVYDSINKIAYEYRVASVLNNTVTATGPAGAPAPTSGMSIFRADAAKHSFVSGKNAYASQIGQQSHSNYGFTQTTTIQLSKLISNDTADQQMTLDGGVPLGGKVLGISNSFIVPKDHGYVGRLTIQAKSLQTDAMAVWERRVVFGDWAGTTTLKDIATIGTDYKDAELTTVPDPLITVVGADNEFRIGVARVAAGSALMFHAVLELSEIKYTF